MNKHPARPIHIAFRQLPIAVILLLFSAAVNAQDTDSESAPTEAPPPGDTETDTDAQSEPESSAEESASESKLTEDTDTAPPIEAAAPASAAAPSAPKAHWYTHINGQNQGPFSQDEMEQMAENGMITHHTKVNKAGTPDWVAAHTVFKFQTPPPPAAPSAATAAPLPTDNTHYLKSKARHVRAGNVMAGIGMLGSAPGLVLQFKGVKDRDIDLYNSGLGTAFVFGGLRFAGVLVSGVAARKYTRMQGTRSDFSWGPFWGGIAVGAAGAVIQYAVAGTTDDIDELETHLNTIIAVAIGTEVLRDIFWIIHCLKAKSATEAHRNVATAALKPKVAFAPIISPRTGSYGLSLGVIY